MLRVPRRLVDQHFAGRVAEHLTHRRAHLTGVRACRFSLRAITIRSALFLSRRPAGCRALPTARTRSRGAAAHTVLRHDRLRPDAALSRLASRAGPLLLRQCPRQRHLDDVDEHDLRLLRTAETAGHLRGALRAERCRSAAPRCAAAMPLLAQLHRRHPRRRPPGGSRSGPRRCRSRQGSRGCRPAFRRREPGRIS